MTDDTDLFEADLGRQYIRGQLQFARVSLSKVAALDGQRCEGRAVE